MSFPSYPNIRDSGVDWLGTLPSHWEVAPFKRLIEIQNGADYKHVEQSEGYPVIGSGGQFTCASEYLYDGESVLLGRKGTIDKPLHVTGRFWTVDTMYWSKIRPCISGRFAYYTATTIPFGYYSTNTALPSMTQSALNTHLVGLPPFPEQTAIAAFLDRETAKIDALVEEQRRLIELLKEKRQAVISHAVTKGLDPTVPMKDSGVEWLGQVPAHWEVRKLRHLARQIVDGAHFTPTYVEEGVPFLRVTDITRPRPNLDEVKRIPQEEHDELILRCKPEQGDLLVSKNGTIGVPAVVTWDWEFSIFVSLCLIKLRDDLDTRFARYVFLSKAIELQINDGAKQSTVNNLHLEKIAGFVFPLPTGAEQMDIVAHLDAVVGRLDGLIHQSEVFARLLLERRAGLISAAVTGKIYVLGAVAQQLDTVAA